MADSLDGLRVACLVANEGVERVELVQPRDALHEVEAVVTIVAPEAGDVQLFDHLDKADVVTADRAAADCSADDFDALLLPGGVANPDQLRMSEDAVRLVREMFDAGKPCAVICHGPWTLVEAGVVHGRRLTSWPSVQTDIRNAGGQWVDEEVVVDDRGPNLLVSSRKPDDLPRFCDEMIAAFARPGLAGGNPTADRAVSPTS